MKEITSQLLSLASMVIIPFIPNAILRYIMIILAPLSFAGYLVYHNTPDRRVARLDGCVKELNALFDTAAKECCRDPRFIHEGGLRLAEINYAVSTLRSRAISIQYTSWKRYLCHLRAIMSSIEGCRREIEEFRTSISLALEFARQQKYREDIGQMMSILESVFPVGKESRERRLGTNRPANGRMYLKSVAGIDQGDSAH
ncbi:hypothetical protein MVEN_01795200 [Mycena venus]|uniref:Uncharacterized protein n=1 Tax=Mycena venus TaxID=2733690 RepID=A0A8H6XKI2_9AGAR|nr:hypothetical protein MVEN_01795200 [Mycena venus]